MVDQSGFDSAHVPTAVTPSAEARDFGATERDRHLLIRFSGEHIGQVTRLAKVPSRVGRSSESEIWIDDDGVSRRHALIAPAAGENKFIIEDLRSSNGTFVAGQRITKRELTDGDIIQFGPRVAYRYLVVDEGQERLLRQLHEASILDALTGAFNREHFNTRLKGELSYARRHKTALSLIMFDVDHFKSVNDNYGHLVGDAVLSTICRAVQSSLRVEDVFARYGGEEFAVILRGEELSRAACVAERLRGAIAALKIPTERGPISVTISLGCASLAECEEGSTKAMIKLADQRLYAAKQAGRNRVVASASEK